MLWYLHLCAIESLVVVEYRDAAVGIMEVNQWGRGRFVEVTLHPRVVIRSPFDSSLAEDPHDKAHQNCFRASSVNFPVRCVPETLTSTESASGPRPPPRPSLERTRCGGGLVIEAPYTWSATHFLSNP